jgi:hypothetical protein
MIQVAYADNKVFTEAIIPTNVTIKTFQPKGKSENFTIQLPLMKNFLFLIVFQMVIIEL